MSSFLELLNQNEGVIAFISLIIVLLGFGVTNLNIKINKSQTQQTGTGGTSQQAGGNLNSQSQKIGDNSSDNTQTQ